MLGRLKKFILKNTQLGKDRYLDFLYRYDKRRYLTHGSQNKNNAIAIAVKMRILIHSIEKGLSLDNSRNDFGKEKAIELLDLMEAYKKFEYKPDRQVLNLCESVLVQYRCFRENAGEDVSFLKNDFKESLPAGAIDFRADKIDDFEKIAHERHSIRTFGEGLVEKEKLNKAVELAQTAPSACNRQSSRVYACLSKEKIDSIIKKHGGMRGFTNVGAILAVTGDLNLYINEYERNTVFVDGGIFLMNLLYSLQCVGLGCCPIIWGAEPDNDSFLYKLLSIPCNEEIISLIIVGNLPGEKIKIPVSFKRDVKDIIHFDE